MPFPLAAAAAVSLAKSGIGKKIGGKLLGKKKGAVGGRRRRRGALGFGEMSKLMMVNQIAGRNSLASNMAWMKALSGKL
jgi:hypothetical protein